MMSLKEEESVIRFLESLTPLEYDILMDKIDRSKWEQRGPVGFIHTIPAYIPERFKRKRNP